MKVAEAPIKTKTNENPRMNNTELSTMIFVFFLSSLLRESIETPEIKDTYAGTKGKTQGETNDSIPAPNAATIEISVI